MSCQYEDKCSYSGMPKCATCVHFEGYVMKTRSYYVEYPSPTSIEWPYLPSGDDLRFPTSTIAVDSLEVWDEAVTLKEVSPYRFYTTRGPNVGMIQH